MKLWQDKVRRVVPYTPGEQPNKASIIKLNTNENPYPPSPMVRRVLEDFEQDRLRLYPDPTAMALRQALAEYYHVSPEMVFCGVGSDDVLSVAFLTFFNSDLPIFFPDITYSFYPVWADVYRIPYETKAVDADLHLVREDYFAENGGIVFPNPNAPTSHYEPLDFVDDIARHNPRSVVIVDEAYIDFAGPSALSLVPKYDNLLVVQTFSKSRALAGLRVGYAIGQPELIRAMNDVKYSINSYTLNQLSLGAGTAAVADDAYFKSCVEKIRATRAWTAGELKKLGFVFDAPSANFIFATHPTARAADIFEKLRARAIYVRYFNLPRIDQYLRITIGTDEQMARLIEALREIVG